RNACPKEGETREAGEPRPVKENDFRPQKIQTTKGYQGRGARRKTTWPRAETGAEPKTQKRLPFQGSLREQCIQFWQAHQGCHGLGTQVGSAHLCQTPPTQRLSIQGPICKFKIYFGS